MYLKRTSYNYAITRAFLALKRLIRGELSLQAILSLGLLGITLILNRNLYPRKIKITEGSRSMFMNLQHATRIL